MLQKDPSFFRYLDMLLYVFAYGYIYLCPYTKVEESFNMQAMHDHLYIPMDINNYDHQEFPGVVPRSFVGSLIVSIMAFPFSFILRHIGYSKFISQYVVRIIISTLFCSSLVRLRKVSTKRYGRSIGVYFIVITLCQFHLLFYSSRPLPNVFATICTTFGFSYWIEEKYRAGIFCFLCGNLIFRCDLIILLGPLALSLLIYGKMTLLEGTICTIKYTFFLILLTVGIDSFFWKHIIYPELEVLYYNTVLNKSSNWGTSPFLWYFYSALPRACSFSLCYLFIGLMASLYNICVAPFATISTLWSASSIDTKKNKSSFLNSVIHLFRFIQSLTMLDGSLSMIVVPCLVFIFLYSFLPHKELRFIFPALPVINLCCALGMTKLFRNKSKNIIPFLSTFVALCLSFCTTLIFLSASIDNYPGGKAMVALHNLKLPNNIPKYVHIDVYSAESGITRFCEIPEWTYSKKENETDYDKYGYLLTHEPEKHQDSFKIIETIQGYTGFDYKHLKPRKGDLIYIMQNTKSLNNFNKKV